MKIVHLSVSDTHDGAAIAAFRLHKALRKSGVDSHMLVTKKLSDDPFVHSVKKPTRNIFVNAFREVNYFFETFLNFFGPQELYSYSSIGLNKNELIQAADIVNLHNIYHDRQNYSLLLLPEIKRPIVWTLHDMWAITGHCYYSFDCDRWKIGCGKCPNTWFYQKVTYDSSGFQWKLKNYIYNKVALQVVTPSNWLTNIACQSTLKGGNPLTIPHGVDISTFYPTEKEKAKEHFGLDASKKVISFCAKVHDIPRKGYKIFEDAMLKLKHRKDEIILLLIGKPLSSSLLNDHFTIKNTGFIKDESLMAKAYSASDIYVMPSYQDNLPSVILESLACGTPCICFDQGGMPDMIEHFKNGLLIPLEEGKNSENLANGINELLNDDARLQMMQQQSFEIVKNKFTENIQANNYIDLYNKILGGSP